MAKLDQKSLSAVYNSIPVADIFDGKLNPNVIWGNLFNKIANQRVIRTFEFSEKFYARYAKRSSLYGDKSEILSFGLARIEDWQDSAGNWIKDKAIVQAYSNIVNFNTDKQYAYTLTDTQMQQAFLSEQKFGNAITEMRDSVEQQKANFWYNYIINTHKTTYKNIVEIEVSSNDSVAERNRKITNKILATIKAFTLPNNKFNVVPDNNLLKTNATPIARQIFTWNLVNMIEYETSITQNFNMTEIDGVKKLLSSDFADYQDDSIIGVLDTDETIYIGAKSIYSNWQSFAKDRYTNFYYNELHECGVIGYTNGVVFKIKQTGTVQNINTIITTSNLGEFGYSGTTPTTDELDGAVKTKNSNWNSGYGTYSAITATSATVTGNGTDCTGTINLSYTKAGS